MTAPCSPEHPCPEVDSSHLITEGDCWYVVGEDGTGRPLVLHVIAGWGPGVATAP